MNLDVTIDYLFNFGIDSVGVEGENKNDKIRKLREALIFFENQTTTENNNNNKILMGGIMLRLSELLINKKTKNPYGRVRITKVKLFFILLFYFYSFFVLIHNRF